MVLVHGTENGEAEGRLMDPSGSHYWLAVLTFATAPSEPFLSSAGSTKRVRRLPFVFAVRFVKASSRRAEITLSSFVSSFCVWALSVCKRLDNSLFRACH